MSKQRWIKYLVLILLAAIMPLVIKNQYVISILVIVGIYTIAVEGLTLLIGFGGQISFGHAGFFVLGMYSSVLITKYFGISPWLSLVIGMLVSSVAGLMVGIPTLKLKGHFLAFGTLAFSMMLFYILNELDGITGGPSGIGGISPLAIGKFEFYGEMRYFYLVWLFAAIAIFVAENIVTSSFGKNIKTIKESELLAEHLKIDTVKEKLKLFIISSIYAGFAGGMYAYYMLYVTPVSGGVDTSVLFLSMAIVGGLTNVWGAMAGALVLMVVGEVTKGLIPIFFTGAGGELEMLAYGAVLVLVLTFMPEGIVPRLMKYKIKCRKKAAMRIPKAKEGLENG